PGALRPRRCHDRRTRRAVGVALPSSQLAEPPPARTRRVEDGGALPHATLRTHHRCHHGSLGEALSWVASPRTVSRGTWPLDRARRPPRPASRHSPGTRVARRG